MRIGFIGLGRMGGPMSRNLAKAGHELFVFDIRRDVAEAAKAYGASPVANPSDAAERAEAVFISVPGPDEDEQIMLGADGVLKGARKGLLVIDATTITVPQSQALARRCSELGIDYVDSPVSGAPHGAEAATLTAMVGGETAAFERALPILKCVCTNIRHIGPSGCGTAIKLINQAVYVSYMSVFAEGLALGEAVGIPLDMMLDILGTSAAGHPMIATKYDEIRGLKKTGFAIERALLFMDLAKDAFRGIDRATPVIDAATESLKRAMTLGVGAEDLIVARNKYLSGNPAP